MIKAIGIYREFELQGRPEKDRRILELTAEKLRKKGFDVLLKEPKDFSGQECPDLIFTMARGKKINEILAEKEKGGLFVINPPQGIRISFNRELAYQKMKEFGVNIPETRAAEIKNIKFSDIQNRSILKAAVRHEFCFAVGGKDDFERIIQEYKNQSIEKIVIQEFIEGRHIKFYVIGREVILSRGIEDEISPEVIEKIRKQARMAGRVTGLKIFGGDIMLQNNATPFCVDANDWPSFASLKGFSQEEASSKIADLIEREYANSKF